ncbi:hypothetical protein T4A_4039 [Trichinella pseudospiralis]|uniref:Uncharacterized protein n=1 Tax=Trichinella pseudospiralis TaxID=6337 RepID=A0A0V1DXJ2_TRIPS|nr:hypothetical protein T4A_4039 [Trichinella pseudospiralis]
MYNKKTWTRKNLFLNWFHRCFISEISSLAHLVAAIDKNNYLEIENTAKCVANSRVDHQQDTVKAQEQTEQRREKHKMRSERITNTKLMHRSALHINHAMFLPRAKRIFKHTSVQTTLTEYSTFTDDSSLSGVEFTTKFKAEMANACCRNLWLDTINTKTTVFPAGEEESHSKDDCHISTSGGGRWFQRYVGI